MARRKHSINPPLNIYKKIAFSFIVLTLLLIVVIFYFTFSYAYISVVPSEQEVISDFNFIIVESTTAENPDDGVFYGNILEEEIEGTKTFKTTGTATLSGDIVGSVKIINNLSRVQPLVATTRLLTPDNVLYRIKEGVEIPAKGSVVAQVYPDDSAKPLAKSGTKFTVPGLSSTLEDLVYAESDLDFQATGQTVAAVSQEDLDKALEVYGSELAQQVLSAEDSSKVKILNKEILTSEYSHEIGDKVDEFSVSLKVKVTGVIFDDQPVKDFALKVTEGLVSADKELFSTNRDNLVYEIETLDKANKVGQINSQVIAKVVLSENSQILDRDKLVKLSLDEIKAYLETFDEIESVEIRFFPSWVKKLPYFQDHILIQIEK